MPGLDPQLKFMLDLRKENMFVITQCFTGSYSPEGANCTRCPGGYSTVDHGATSLDNCTGQKCSFNLFTETQRVAVS